MKLIEPLKLQGICSNIYGPTWLDLKSLMNTTLEKMSISISLRAAFFCVGAIIGGFIYKLIDRGALYPLFILTKGLCVALIPLYANYYAFLVYSALIGLVSGAADTSVNVWVIDIWKDRSAPFVQALQFFWSVGFIVSPLISNPFLSPESKEHKLNKLFKTATETKDILPPEEHQRLVKHSSLHVPYIAAGAICLVGSVSLLVIYVYRRIERCALKNRIKEDEQNGTGQVKSAENAQDEKKAADDYENHPAIEYSKKKLYLIQILLFVSIMTSAFCANEMTFLQYAATFAVKLDLDITKRVATLIMTGIASSFAFGRFCGIFCAMKFKPIHILYADWIIIMLGHLILLVSNNGIHFLWIGTILVGFGYASFFAAIFSYLRERCAVNNVLSSVVILASLSGNAIGYPIFIGKYLETEPLMLIYGNIALLLVMFACFIGLAVLDCKFGVKASIIRKLKESQNQELLEK